MVAMSKDILYKQQQRNFLLKALDYTLYKAHSLFKALLDIFRGVSIEDIDYSKIDKIKSLENNGKLKEAAAGWKKILNEYPDSIQSPLVMIKMAFAYHKDGEFDKAHSAYKKLIKTYPFSTEAQTSKILIKKIKERKSNLKSVKASFKKADQTLDSNQKQKILYNVALEQLAFFDIKGAVSTLRQAESILSDTITYYQIRLRLGWCANMLGDRNQAVSVFNDILKTKAAESVKSKARYQLVLIYASQNKKDKAKEMIEETLAFLKGQKARPVVLFSAGNVFSLDFKDKDLATFYFSKFIEEFPADSLAYNTAEIADNYANVDVMPNVSVAAKGFMSGKSLLEKLIPKKFLDAIKRGAVRFTERITEGVTEIVVLEEYDVEKGDFVTIDLTEKRLNKYIKKWFPVGNKIKIWDVYSKFEGERELTMYGVIHLTNKLKIKGLISGKFEIVKAMDRPYWLHDLKNRKFTVFLVKKAKVAGIPVPKAILHIILRPCVVQFNKDFPLDVDLFVLDKNHIVFAGLIREDIKQEIRAEAYGGRHLSQRDEESGFIYGRRKESLSDSDTGTQTESTAIRDRDIGGLSVEGGF